MGHYFKIMVLSEGILYKILYKIYKNANIVEWIIFIMKKRVFWKHFEADSRSFLLLNFVFVNGTCERCSGFVWKYGKILVSCLKHAVNGKCYYFGGAIILKKALRPKLQMFVEMRKICCCMLSKLWSWQKIGQIS